MRANSEKLSGTYLGYLPTSTTYRIDTHTVPGLGARLAIITNEAVGCAPASEQLHLSGR